MSTDRQEILVVEDDAKVAYSVSAGLRREGLQVTRCGTGSRATAHFETERVDLVILDLGLPDMDGLEVLRRLPAKCPGPRPGPAGGP